MKKQTKDVFLIIFYFLMACLGGVSILFSNGGNEALATIAAYIIFFGFLNISNKYFGGV